MTSYDSLPSMTSSAASWPDFASPATPEDHKMMAARPRIHGDNNITLDIPQHDPKVFPAVRESPAASVTGDTGSEVQEPVTPTSIESHSPIFALEQADKALKDLPQMSTAPPKSLHDTSDENKQSSPSGQESLTPQLTHTTSNALTEISTVPTIGTPTAPTPPTSAIARSPPKHLPPTSEPHPTIKRANTFSKLLHRTSSGLHLPKLGTTMSHDNGPLSPRSRPRSGFFSHHPSPAPSQANTPPTKTSPTNSLNETSGSVSPPKHSLFGASIGRLTREKRSSSMNGITTISAGNAVSLPVDEGVGSKSRRLSTMIPDVQIPVVELGTKYCSKSHVPMRTKQVGEGATAIVKLMVKVAGDPNQLFAVKEFRKKSASESEQEYNQKLNSEFCLSRSLHHPNIVETADLCRSSNNRWCHVMEYCQGGDLFSLIKKNYMGVEEKMCCFKQLLRGVHYLHSHGIAHRDIKPENLLICSDGHLKITDFGISEVFSGRHPGVAGLECGLDMETDIRMSKPGISGSKPYLSPEVIQRKNEYDPRKLDVWSCAIVYITLHYGGFPWVEASNTEKMYAAYEKSWDSWLKNNPDGEITATSTVPGARIFSDMKPPLRRLLYKMAHPLPEKRILIDDALNDRWISSSVECCVIGGEEDEPSSPDEGKPKKTPKMKVMKLHNHMPKSTNFSLHHHEH